MNLFGIDKPLYRGKCTSEDKWVYGYYYSKNDTSYILNDDGEYPIKDETLGIYVGEGLTPNNHSCNAYSGDIIIFREDLRERLMLHPYWLGIIDFSVSNLGTNACVDYIRKEEIKNSAIRSIGRIEKMPLIYYIIGNIHDNKISLQSFNTIDDEKDWYKANVYGKGTRNLFKEWEKNSYSYQEMKIIYKYANMSENEYYELLQEYDAQRTTLLALDTIELYTKTRDKYTKKAEEEIQELRNNQKEQ